MRRLTLALCAASLLMGGNAVAAKKPRKQSIPVFSAQSYLIANEDGTIVKEVAGDTVRPIASITKLMVSLLAAEQNLDEMLSVPASKQVQSSIPRGVKELSRRDLLALSLVKSDNFAAQILCENIPGCIDRMNERATSIGMKDTKFFEPTGLSKENVSTAHDLLKLMLVASTSTILKDLSSLPIAEITTGAKTFKVRNTNPLTSKLTITLSKTGFTNPAGGCLVMIMQSPVGQKILILLGSRNARTRIPDMERLVKEV
jgi:D-alanyl-D-alanine endopeptidase (penicillin-binding protein 7)